MIKASDVRSVFGTLNQKQPLYRHTLEEKNHAIRGVDVAELKFRPSICQKCNNARTQAHDRAWERMSAGCRELETPLAKGDRLPLEVMFGEHVADQMLAVHLYFLKLLGCYAVEYDVPLPLKSFAVALLGGHPHPHVYLSFSDVKLIKGKSQIHVGNIEAVNFGGITVGATWFYVVERLGVWVSYSEKGRPRSRPGYLWHPDDEAMGIVLR